MPNNFYINSSLSSAQMFQYFFGYFDVTIKCYLFTNKYVVDNSEVSKMKKKIGMDNNYRRMSISTHISMTFN